MNNYRHLTDLVTRAVLFYRAVLKPDDIDFSLADKTKQEDTGYLEFLLKVKNNKNKPVRCFDVTWECIDEEVLDIFAINGLHPQEITSFEVPPKDAEEFVVEVRVKAHVNKETATANTISEESVNPYVLGIHCLIYGLGKKKYDQGKRFDITKSVKRFL